MRPSLFSVGLKLGFVVALFIAFPTILIFYFSPEITLWRILSYLLFIIVVCTALTWMYVERPIREMVRLMKKTEKEHYLTRMPVRSSDAVGQLADTSNQLLQRITTLDASKIESERQLFQVQEELKIKKALEKSLEELSLLNEFSHKMISVTHLDELYSVLGSFLGDRLRFQEFALLLREEENEDVVVQVARGFADSSRVRGMRFHKGEGLTGLVFQTQQHCYVPDTRQEPRYLYYKGEKREDGSFLSIPLVVEGKVVGIFNFTRPGVNSFSTQEIQFLNTISIEVALALEKARLYMKTRELAVRDELTKLYNRRYFQETLLREIKRAQRFGQPLSLLMIDLDHFKKYNDTFGHLEGDRRLQDFAKWVSSSIREVDFFARFGGEEFVLILPNTSKQDAVGVAEKVCQLIRSCSKDEKEERRQITASIGVACYPFDQESMEGLLEAADIALYKAKGRGRDRAVAYQNPHSNLKSLSTSQS